MRQLGWNLNGVHLQKLENPTCCCGNSASRRHTHTKADMAHVQNLWRASMWFEHSHRLLQPLLGLFHSEPGNGLWKRKADAAFQRCTTIKSFLEETLLAIPDSVLDSPITEASSGWVDTFANSKVLLPPPYTATEEEVLYD
ncbi:unnamed protein product [Ilex paraguariensis]|uniref:Uncharacterized protein n=1 Tax=Ilex paraguariensis TaxID=185542 RepID=A0ABC8R5V6_9AQUA